MDGEATAPMIASVARAILSSSDSNQWSRIGRAAPVRISMARGPSAPSFRKRQPSRASASRLRGLSGQRLVGVTVQLQVADDLGSEQAVHVSGGRDLEPGPELLGDAGAADDVPPLEHQYRHPGPRKVRGGDEAVVAGPDDDDVVRSGHEVPSNVTSGALGY